MWQLSQQPLTIKQVLLQSYVLFKVSLYKMPVLLALFFVWLALPYLVASFVNTGLTDLLHNFFAVKVFILMLIYFIGIFWIYAAFYCQLNFMMQHDADNMNNLTDCPAGTAADCLYFVLKKLPVLMIAFVLAIIANVFGWVLLLVPGVYLMVVITLYYPLIVIDDLGPLKGFEYAVNLVRGNWWRSALVMVVPPLLSSLLVLVCNNIIFLIVHLLHLPVAKTIIANICVQLFLGTLFLPMSAAVNLMQIHNLKLRKSAVSSEPPKVNLSIVHG